MPCGLFGVHRVLFHIFMQSTIFRAFNAGKGPAESEVIIMWNWKNNRVKTKFGEIPLSRIVASWRNEGGDIPRRRIQLTQFWKWCTSELEMSESDTWDAVNLAQEGKMELEHSAKEFLSRIEDL